MLRNYPHQLCSVKINKAGGDSWRVRQAVLVLKKFLVSVLLEREVKCIEIIHLILTSINLTQLPVYVIWFH